MIDMTDDGKGNSVMVGMSGGVDSSVAALLLKERGYEVTGVTFWLWNYPDSPEYRGEENNCCSIDLAATAAEQVGVPHRKLDLSEEFQELIVSYTKKTYKEGKTPNPCARCNRYVRFGLVLEKAEEMGFDYIATGHHVRKRYFDDEYHLLKGLDDNKDQSYFLYGLGREELSKSIFPIGEYEKEQIYDIAREYDLTAAELPESQDLCFVPNDDYRQFLTSEGVDPKAGKMVNTQGEVLGSHEGLPYYTIGQRRGLGLESNEARYVVDLKPAKNQVIVGSREDLYSSGLIASELNWVNEPSEGPVEAKIRYRSPSVEADLTRLGRDKVQVLFREPQRAVTPGQIVALYRGEELLGGGKIERALGEEEI